MLQSFIFGYLYDKNNRFHSFVNKNLFNNDSVFAYSYISEFFGNSFLAGLRRLRDSFLASISSGALVLAAKERWENEELKIEKRTDKIFEDLKNACIESGTTLDEYKSAVLHQLAREEALRSSSGILHNTAEEFKKRVDEAYKRHNPASRNVPEEEKEKAMEKASKELYEVLVNKENPNIDLTTLRSNIDNKKLSEVDHSFSQPLADQMVDRTYNLSPEAVKKRGISDAHKDKLLSESEHSVSDLVSQSEENSSASGSSRKILPEFPHKESAELTFVQQMLDQIDKFGSPEDIADLQKALSNRAENQKSGNENSSLSLDEQVNLLLDQNDSSTDISESHLKKSAKQSETIVDLKDNEASKPISLKDKEASGEEISDPTS
jgi:hypothetical protein